MLQSLFLSIILMLSQRDVSLAWNPSISPDVTNYAVLRSRLPVNASGEFADSIRIILGNQVSATLLNLPDGTWYFAVIARDKDGNKSVYSNVVSSPLNPLTVAPATDLRLVVPIITELTNTTVTVVWRTEAPASGYLAIFTKTGILVAVFPDNHQSHSLAHVAQAIKLIPDTLYRYHAVSDDGVGQVFSAGGSFFTKP